MTLNQDYFDALFEGQKPEFLYTECSDSRVTAKDLMGVNPGEDYVHRNAANMLVSANNNVNAVVEYAAEQLCVKHIIVCGHYGCGGINAALHPSDLGQLAQLGSKYQRCIPHPQSRDLRNFRPAKTI